MIVATLFSMAVIVYCLVQGQDLRIFETAITMAFGTIASVLAFYIGGASWEETSKSTSKSEVEDDSTALR